MVMKKIVLLILFLVLSPLARATTFYLDYENGNDTNNGTTWALAWKTLTTGATEARITAGDVIRIAKSPEPVSLGSVTWTDNSATVTLASAATANIDDGEVAWTASADVTATASSTYEKEGTNSAKLVIAGEFTTGIIAYKQISDTDFSDYDETTFWLRTTAAIAANCLRLDLCSDIAGVTVVDSMIIDHALVSGYFYPIHIDNGGALGSSIQSVALYARTDPGSVTIYIDNILACNGFNLTSLIGKNTDAESWWTIKSINGTTVILGNVADYGSTVRKYQGASEGVTSYYRETIKTTLATSTTINVQQIMDAGTYGGNSITFSGGWNTSTTEQDGETWFDGINGLGNGIYMSAKDYITFDNISLTRYYIGIYATNTEYTYGVNITSNGNQLYGIHLNISTMHSEWDTLTANQNVQAGLVFEQECNSHTVTVGRFYSNTSGVTWGSNASSNGCHLDSCYAYGNQARGFHCSNTNDAVIKNSHTKNNITCGIICDNSQVYFYNCLLEEASEMNWGASGESKTSFIRSHRHDQVEDRFKDWYPLGMITDQITAGQEASWARGGSGLCVYLAPLSTIYPLEFVFKVPVSDGVAFTVSFYVKKTGEDPTLTFSSYGAGITPINDASVTVTTSWAQYTSSSMTPTENGFVEITLKALDSWPEGDIGIDDISISAGGYSDFGECDYWYYGAIDGGIVGSYFGSMDRWYYGSPDGGITDASAVEGDTITYMRIKGDWRFRSSYTSGADYMRAMDWRFQDTTYVSGLPGGIVRIHGDEGILKIHDEDGIVRIHR